MIVVSSGKRRLLVVVGGSGGCGSCGGGCSWSRCGVVVMVGPWPLAVYVLPLPTQAAILQSTAHTAQTPVRVTGRVVTPDDNDDDISEWA